jgi:hypothetical protein
MPSRRLAVPVAIALALAPGLASAGIPVAIYPFKVPGLAAEQRGELHEILEAGLASASRRGILAARAPALLPATCGEAPGAACLANLTKGGLVLAGRGELKSGLVLVTAALWDASGTRTREVRFVVDLVIQNLRPVNDSLLELEIEIEPDGRVARDDRKLPARDPHGPPPPKPALAATPAAPPPPTTAGPSAHGPTAVARVTIAEPPPLALPHWKRKVGPWLTGIGAALVAGGAAVGWVNHGVADELDARYARGDLRPSDASSYDRVRTYNLVSTALLAAGGAAVATGGYLWISAPAHGPGAAVGAGGRF